MSPHHLPTRFWIDTDPGLDDALAILVALSSVGRQIVGFSSVVGNVSEYQAAFNLSRLLRAIREAGGTPSRWSPTVARGSQTSLLGVLSYGGANTESNYHGIDGMADMPWKPELEWCVQSPLPAAQMIVNAARNSEKLCIVCLGPLTNVALALRLEPKLPVLIHSIIVMGGSLRAGGNTTMAAEFNFAVDPEAAHIVLQAGFREFRLVPIDACQDAELTKLDYDAITQLSSPAAKLFVSLMHQWEGLFTNNQRVVAYDVVAWLLALHEDLAEWQSVYVDVDTGHSLARGASLADWRHSSDRTPNVRAAMSIPNPVQLVEKLLHHLA